MFETQLETTRPLHFLKVELNTSTKQSRSSPDVSILSDVEQPRKTAFLCKSHLYSRFHIDGHFSCQCKVVALHTPSFDDEKAIYKATTLHTATKVTV